MKKKILLVLCFCLLFPVLANAKKNRCCKDCPKCCEEYREKMEETEEQEEKEGK